MQPILTRAVTAAGTLSARDDLSLVTGGSLILGRVTTVTLPLFGHVLTTTSVADGTIRAGGDAWIEAAGDLTSTASLIQAGGSLGIAVGGALTNTRPAQAQSKTIRAPTTYASNSSEAAKYEPVPLPACPSRNWAGARLLSRLRFGVSPFRR